MKNLNDENKLIIPTEIETAKMLGKIDTSFLIQKYLSSYVFFAEENFINKKRESVEFNNKLKVSQFTYAFQSHNIVALYHSLKLRVVYFPKSVFNLFFYLIRKQGFAKVLLRNVPNNRFTNRIFKKLYQMGFLILNNREDKLLLLSAQKNFLRPQLRRLYIIATNKCNLKCRYCYLRRNILEGNLSMDIRTAKRGIDLFISSVQKYFPNSGRISICFYGGEPLLNFQVVKLLIEYLNSLRSKISRMFDAKIEIVTNGTLITEEIAYFLKKTGVGVNLSIDGGSLRTNVHRVFENGTNSLNVVLKSIKILNKVGVPMTIVTTISPQTLPYFGEITSFLIPQSTSSCINILRPNLQLKINDKFVEDAIKAQLNGFKMFRIVGHYEERITKKVFHFTKKLLYPFYNGFDGQELAIFPNGRVGVYHGSLGCNRYLVGKIETLTSEKITENLLFKEWATKSPLKIPKCWGCPALGICGGERPAEIKEQSESISRRDRFHCIQSKIILEWLVWDNLQNIKN